MENILTIEPQNPGVVSSMPWLGRVLVACEYSGAVRDAFAKLGWDAWSCDLLPSETPGNHYQGDVRDVLGQGWDILIAINGVDKCSFVRDHKSMRYAPIKNFPAYRVSDAGWVETRWRTGNFYNGFIRPNETWRRMKHNERPDGYHGVELRDGLGGKRRTYVHILVAEAFVGPKPFKGAVVRHKDGKSSNNAASNLQWGTHLENEMDKKRHGTWNSRYGGKLTDEKRKEIRTRAANGESQRKLAEEFGVSRPTITRLVNGTTWRVDQ
jgi:hypothetical protein